MAIYEEMQIDQGSTFSYLVSIKNLTDQAPFDLSGYTGTAHMKRSYKSLTISATFTVVVGLNGIVTLSLTDEQTALIKSGRYLYDVVIESPEGEVYRVIEGIADVTPAVTTL